MKTRLNSFISTLLAFITIVGVVLIIGGAWYSVYVPKWGWSSMVLGFAMTYFAKRGVHHNYTQPAGFLLGFLGVILSVISMVSGGAWATLYYIAIGMVVSGVSLLSGRSGGWQGTR